MSKSWYCVQKSDRILHYDVICIDKTWLIDLFCDELIVSNAEYTIHHCDRVGEIGGGCAIFIDIHLNARQIHFSGDVITTDFQYVCAEIETAENQLAVCYVYNPPGHKDDCSNALTNIINSVCSKY